MALSFTKKKSGQHFSKEKFISDDSRATSTQTIVNEAPEQDKGQNKEVKLIVKEAREKVFTQIGVTLC